MTSSKPTGSAADLLRAEALVRYANPEHIRRAGVTAATFAKLYAGQPPWEIGQPQPFVVDREREGLFRGAVLDVGCGRGENAFFLASRGYAVSAIDFVEDVVADARREMARRGLTIDFRVMDATDLTGLGQAFDTVLDSATFHTFTRDQRLLYADALRHVTQPGSRLHLVGLSDKETRPGGPPRVSQADIREAFAVGWRLDAITEQLYVAATFPGGGRAWAADIVRV